MMLHLVSRARHQAGSNRRKYANAYHNNHDGPPCSAYLFMFVVGAGMVITAILMLVASARHGREHAVDEYSHRISNWTHYRQQLQRTNFSVGAITAIESGTKRDVKPFFLPMDKTPEQQLEGKDSDNAKDLPPYKPLKYQSSGGTPHALLPTLNFTTTAAHAAVTATSSTAQANRAQTAAAQVPNEWAQLVLTASYTFPSGDGRDPVTSDLVTAAFPLWTKKVVPGQTPAPERKCPEQQKGTWVRNQCEIFHRLVDLCLVVDLNENTGEWSFAPRRSKDPYSYGCAKGSASQILGGSAGQAAAGTHSYSETGLGGGGGVGLWRPATYDLVRATVTGSATIARTATKGPLVYHFPLTNLDDVNVGVRSAHDPFIEAQKATKGSLDFGLSSSENFTLGLALLCLGALLLIAPGFQIWGCYKEWREEQNGLARYSVVGGDDHEDLEGVRSDSDDDEEKGRRLEGGRNTQVYSPFTFGGGGGREGGPSRSGGEESPPSATSLDSSGGGSSGGEGGGSSGGSGVRRRGSGAAGPPPQEARKELELGNLGGETSRESASSSAVPPASVDNQSQVFKESELVNTAAL